MNIKYISHNTSTILMITLVVYSKVKKTASQVNERATFKLFPQQHLIRVMSSNSFIYTL